MSGIPEHQPREGQGSGEAPGCAPAAGWLAAHSGGRSTPWNAKEEWNIGFDYMPF